ncbi:MAG: aminoglycoside adenylyltransferase domain-containing protein [Ruthenibacterium lactatiformans]
MTRDSTRKEGRAHPDDPRVRILLHRIAAACRNTLGDTLAGVYVHGSLAFGCFCWTQSDIDFLVAVRRPLSQTQKEALLRALLALEPDAPSKGLEVSAVLEAYCRAFIHPTPYELHYSPMHRARCLRDLPAYCAEMHGADPDLAAHFTVARAVGLTLWGPPAESMFGPVPRAAYLDSIRQDVGTACSDILRTPASTTLNLCRTLAFAQEGLVLSKNKAGFGPRAVCAPICRLRTKRGGKLPFRRAFSARARTGTGIRSLSSAVHLPPGLLRAKHLSTSRDTTVKERFPQAVPPVENALFISCFTVQPPRSARCATPSAASRSALRT